jgi:hypothetical protein
MGSGDSMNTPKVKISDPDIQWTTRDKDYPPPLGIPPGSYTLVRINQDSTGVIPGAWYMQELDWTPLPYPGAEFALVESRANIPLAQIEELIANVEIESEESRLLQHVMAMKTDLLPGTYDVWDGLRGETAPVVAWSHPEDLVTHRVPGGPAFVGVRSDTTIVVAPACADWQPKRGRQLTTLKVQPDAMTLESYIGCRVLAATEDGAIWKTLTIVQIDEEDAALAHKGSIDMARMIPLTTQPLEAIPNVGCIVPPYPPLENPHAESERYALRESGI